MHAEDVDGVPGCAAAHEAATAVPNPFLHTVSVLTVFDPATDTSQVEKIFFSKAACNCAQPYFPSVSPPGSPAPSMSTFPSVATSATAKQNGAPGPVVKQPKSRLSYPWRHPALFCCLFLSCDPDIFDIVRRPNAACKIALALDWSRFGLLSIRRCSAPQQRRLCTDLSARPAPSSLSYAVNTIALSAANGTVSHSPWYIGSSLGPL